MPGLSSTSFFGTSFRLSGVAGGVRAWMRAICGALVRPGWAPPVSEPAIEWRRYWGDEYGPELKRRLLKPVFDELEETGRMGNVIVDVGSGAAPVTGLVKRKAGRKRIMIDIAADGMGGSADEMRVRLDAEMVSRPGALSLRKALVRVCEFLELDPRAESHREGADTMVFSDILNYVDFREVLRGFADYLKMGGRIVVINLPVRGNAALFSEKGLKDNRQLYRFLDEQGFEIEDKSFPCRPGGVTDEAEELIVLVARRA